MRHAVGEARDVSADLDGDPLGVHHPGRPAVRRELDDVVGDGRATIRRRRRPGQGHPAIAHRRHVHIRRRVRGADEDRHAGRELTRPEVIDGGDAVAHGPTVVEAGEDDACLRQHAILDHTPGRPIITRVLDDVVGYRMAVGRERCRPGQRGTTGPADSRRRRRPVGRADRGHEDRGRAGGHPIHVRGRDPEGVGPTVDEAGDGVRRIRQPDSLLPGRPHKSCNPVGIPADPGCDVRKLPVGATARQPIGDDADEPRRPEFGDHGPPAVAEAGADAGFTAHAQFNVGLEVRPVATDVLPGTGEDGDCRTAQIHPEVLTRHVGRAPSRDGDRRPRNRRRARILPGDGT